MNVTVFAKNIKYNISKEVQKRGFHEVNSFGILLNRF